MRKKYKLLIGALIWNLGLLGSVSLAGDDLYLFFENNSSIPFADSQDSSHAIQFAGDDADQEGFFCMYEHSLSNISDQLDVGATSPDYWTENRQSGHCQFISDLHDIGKFGLVFNSSAGQHTLQSLQWTMLPGPNDQYFYDLRSLNNAQGVNWVGDYANDIFVTQQSNHQRYKISWGIPWQEIVNTAKVSIVDEKDAQAAGSDSYSEMIGYIPTDPSKIVTSEPLYKIVIASGSFQQPLVQPNKEAYVSMIFKPYEVDGIDDNGGLHLLGYVLPQGKATVTNGNTLTAGDSVFYYAPGFMGGYTKLRITQTLVDNSALTSFTTVDLSSLPQAAALPACLTSDGMTTNKDAPATTVMPLNNTMDQSDIKLTVGSIDPTCSLTDAQYMTLRNAVYFTTTSSNDSNTNISYSITANYLVTNIYPQNKDDYVAISDLVGSYDSNPLTSQYGTDPINPLQKHYYLSLGAFSAAPTSFTINSAILHSPISADSSFSLAVNSENPKTKASNQIAWSTGSGTSTGSTTITFEGAPIYSPKSATEALSYRYYPVPMGGNNMYLTCDDDQGESCDAVVPDTVVLSQYYAVWWGGNDDDESLDNSFGAANFSINAAGNTVTIPGVQYHSGHKADVALTVVSNAGEPVSINKGVLANG